MSPQHSTEHATFVIERSYDADPVRVFAAWASLEAKRAWFGPPDHGADTHELDFRIGGRETFAVTVDEVGTRYSYDALYQDIVDGERIVYTYEMHRNEDRISVSVATVEMRAAEGGTALKLTEQGVFLDGHDTVAQREHGTRELMEALAKALDATKETTGS
jgi:uncharacterized protein YndB with AHSA1/START domain